MSFNELNSVENYIIHQLSGINLNQPRVKEEKIPYGFQWSYKPGDKLKRGVNEVIEEGELRNALIRINPEIAKQPERADEVIYKLRAILISVSQTGLVRANEEFHKWLVGGKTMPF